MSRGTPTTLSYAEYRDALTADHGNVRRYLAGCRCDRCDRPAHRRFMAQLPRLRPSER